MGSGFWDHIPKDLYSKNFPKLDAFVSNIANNATIKDFNAKFQQRLADFKDDAKKKGVKVVTYSGRKVSNKGGNNVTRAMCVLNADGGSGVSGKVVFEDVGGKTKIKAEVTGLK